MAKEAEIHTVKFAPRAIGILTLAFCTALFGGLCAATLFSAPASKGLTGFIAYGIVLFFFFAFIASIYYLFTVKSIYIHKNSLTIQYPFIFRKKEIPFSDIHGQDVLPFIVKYSRHEAADSSPIHSGQRIWLWYGNHKKVELNSFMIKNFDVLKEHLEHMTVASGNTRGSKQHK